MNHIHHRDLRVERLEQRHLLATYYVDAVDGADSAPGTSPEAAWQSLSRVQDQSLTNGDRVFLRRGSAWDQTLRLDGDAGITFGAYGSGEAPRVPTLDIRSSSNDVLVEDLLIDHLKQAGDAVRIRDSAGVVLRNLEVRNGTSDGIDVTNADNLVVEGSLIHHFLKGSFENQQDAHGIVVSDSDDVTVRNTEIHHVSGDSFQVDPDRDTNVPTNILIERSHFWTAPLLTDFNSQWLAGQRPGENAIDTKVVTSGWDGVSRLRIEIRDVIAHGWVADGFIENRAAFNMKEKIEAVFDGITVFDNEIAFRLRGARGNANVTMRNVVLYDNETAIRAEDNLANLEVQNSTFGSDNLDLVDFAGGSGGVPTWSWTNNAFLEAVPSVATEPSNFNATTDDFVDAALHDYRPSASSGLRDSGVTLSLVTSDRNGTLRPQGAGYDIGAYEFLLANPQLVDSDSDSNEILESALPGTPVGISAFAEFADGPPTYALVDNAEGRFAIDSETGVVTVASPDLLDGPANRLITVVATGSDGTESSASFEVDVYNVAPNPPIIWGPVREAFGRSIELRFASTDPSAIDTADGFSYSIDWGDGSTVDTVSRTNVVAEAAHDFASPGLFTVSVTATDADGAVSEFSQHTVAIGVVNLAAARQVSDSTPGFTFSRSRLQADVQADAVWTRRRSTRPVPFGPVPFEWPSRTHIDLGWLSEADESVAVRRGSVPGGPVEVALEPVSILDIGTEFLGRGIRRNRF